MSDSAQFKGDVPLKDRTVGSLGLCGEWADAMIWTVEEDK